MNELPQVLQKEIWEYARGDRAYWRQYYEDNVLCRIMPYIVDPEPRYTGPKIKLDVPVVISAKEFRRIFGLPRYPAPVLHMTPKPKAPRPKQRRHPNHKEHCPRSDSRHQLKSHLANENGHNV